MAKGVSKADVAVQMRELSGMQARITLPHVGSTQAFDFERGGKQGGVETPGQWNASVDYIMRPVVSSWHQRGLGFWIDQADDPSAKLVSHAVWADNVFLFAGSFETMQTMISEMDAAFGKFRDSAGRRYFEWKKDSLEYLIGGTLRDTSDETLQVPIESILVHYERKERLVILGDCIDSRGTTSTSIQFNLGRAETLYFRHQEALRDRGGGVGRRL